MTKSVVFGFCIFYIITDFIIWKNIRFMCSFGSEEGLGLPHIQSDSLTKGKS